MVENAVAVEQSFVGGARNITESALIQLATEPQLQKDFIKKVVGKMDQEKFGEYQTYEKNEELGCFTKEVLRMYGSSGMLDDRDVVKEFSLGKYKFFRGTLVNVPFNAIQFDEQYYSKPNEFRIDRFSEKNPDQKWNQERNTYLPFWSGKRACPARHLGELLIQQFIIHIARNFELKRLENFEFANVYEPDLGPDECFLRIKPRV